MTNAHYRVNNKLRCQKATAAAAETGTVVKGAYQTKYRFKCANKPPRAVLPIIVNDREIRAVHSAAKAKAADRECQKPYQQQTKPNRMQEYSKQTQRSYLKNDGTDCKNRSSNNTPTIENRAPTKNSTVADSPKVADNKAILKRGLFTNSLKNCSSQTVADIGQGFGGINVCGNFLTSLPSKPERSFNKTLKHFAMSKIYESPAPGDFPKPPTHWFDEAAAADEELTAAIETTRTKLSEKRTNANLTPLQNTRLKKTATAAQVNEDKTIDNKIKSRRIINRNLFKGFNSQLPIFKQVVSF